MAVLVVVLVVAVAAVAAIVGSGGDDDQQLSGAGTTDTVVGGDADTTPPTSSPDDPAFTLPNLTLPTQGSGAPLTVPDLSVPDTIVVPTAPGGAVPAPTEEPTGLGTDAELDDLAQRCYDGGLVACDVLYAISPEASEYERYGDTCAGRQGDDAGFCGRFASFPGPDWDLGASAVDVPEFVDAARCWAGDMSACDVVGKSSEVEDLRNLGTSCAGRQDVGLGDCVGAFPAYELLLEPVPGTTPTGTTATGTAPAGSDPAGSAPAGDVPPPTEEPTGLGDDVELNALAEACYEGDMGACDDLYDAAQTAALDTYSTYGDTCAGRQPEGTRRYCADTFGG